MDPGENDDIIEGEQGVYAFVDLAGLRDALPSEGGMGSVHLAMRHKDALPVAVKRLHQRDPQIMQRFEREVRLLARLSHPGIVRYIDVEKGSDGRPRSLIIEWLSGESLTHAIKRGISLSEALDIAEQIAVALAYVHGQGSTHRDIKPGNIILEEGLRVRIFDFGVSVDNDSDNEVGSEDEEQGELTQRGLVLGSLGYMPNEGVTEDAGRAMREPSADVYSLGAILFEMLAEAGVRWRILKEDDSTLKKIMAILYDKGMTLERIAMIRQEVREHVLWSGGLLPLLDRMTRPTPSERPSMDQVGTALAELRLGLSSSQLVESETCDANSLQPDSVSTKLVRLIRWPRKKTLDRINAALGILVTVLYAIILLRP